MQQHRCIDAAALRGGRNTRHCLRSVLAATALQLLVFTAPLAALKVIPDTLPPYTSAGALDVQYIVTLNADADAHTPVAPSPTAHSWAMTDARGRRFLCSGGQAGLQADIGAPGDAVVPDPSGDSATITPSGTSGLLGSGQGEERAEWWGGQRTPFQLLDALKAMCLYRNDGLWTYEVCYKKQTRQFRQKDVAGKAEDFSCGSYTGDSVQSEAMLEDVRSSGGAFTYVAHTMAGGEKCVLTGQPRSSEVRYTCLRDYPENALVSVREFPTCNYIFTVSTPFLCKHPQFKPPPDPVHVVSCSPLADAAAAGPSEGEDVPQAYRIKLGLGDDRDELEDVDVDDEAAEGLEGAGREHEEL